MTATLDTYEEYARVAIENYNRQDAERRYLFVNSVGDLKIKRVLDVGCGAGQELLPFVEKTKAFCVGIDAARELGAIGGALLKKINPGNRVAFTRSFGERLPFADASFDVVLCRVAIPYMHNRETIAEIARVLRPNGIFLLKTHAPAFYFGMIQRRWKSFSPKQIAYPLICLAGGAWHSLTGKQLQNGFWKGKEVYQTTGFLKREFAKNNLRIEGYLSDTNVETPSYIVRKIK